jgi:hypothetical protein
MVAHHNDDRDAGMVKFEQRLNEQFLLRRCWVCCLVRIATEEEKIYLLLDGGINAHIKAVLKIQKTGMDTRLWIYAPIIFNAEMDVGCMKKFNHIKSVESVVLTAP